MTADGDWLRRENQFRDMVAKGRRAVRGLRLRLLLEECVTGFLEFERMVSWERGL